MPPGLARYWAAKRGTNPHKRRRNRRHVRHSRRTNPRHGHVMRVGRHYRAHARRTNRRHVSRRRRTNPRLRLPSGMAGGIIRSWVIPAAIGGAGAFGLDIGWGYLSPHLPAQLQSGWFGLLAKSTLVIGGAYMLGRVLPRQRANIHRAGLGAVTVLAATAIKGAAQSVLPATTPGLSGYIDYQSYALPGAGRLHGYMSQGMPRTLGSLEDLYSPAAVIQPPGTPVPRQFGGLRGYIAAQPHMASGGGLMGYDWQNDGM